MFEEEELLKEEPTPEPQFLKEESGKMTKDQYLKSIIWTIDQTLNVN